MDPTLPSPLPCYGPLTHSCAEEQALQASVTGDEPPEDEDYDGVRFDEGGPLTLAKVGEMMESLLLIPYTSSLQ